MLKNTVKFIIIILNAILMLYSNSYAYENAFVISDGTFSDINIEDNTIVDVFPLITVMNEKNTLIFRPLKEGKTKVCVLKNKKEKVMFNVKITDTTTVISDNESCEIFILDSPPIDEDFEIDLPPQKLGGT